MELPWSKSKEVNRRTEFGTNDSRVIYQYIHCRRRIAEQACTYSRADRYRWERAKEIPWSIHRRLFCWTLQHCWFNRRCDERKVAYSTKENTRFLAGWTPRTFQSSRQKRKSMDQRPEDYMDTEVCKLKPYSRWLERGEGFTDTHRQVWFFSAHLRLTQW